MVDLGARHRDEPTQHHNHLSWPAPAGAILPPYVAPHTRHRGRVSRTHSASSLAVRRGLPTVRAYAAGVHAFIHSSNSSTLLGVHACTVVRAQRSACDAARARLQVESCKLQVTIYYTY
eukprot:COSAG02_NODE_4754_length_5022_cov_2.228113_4_plen_119_part_00